MYRQLKKIPLWGNRAKGLLLVLFITTVALSLYISRPGRSSKMNTTQPGSYQMTFLSPGNFNIILAYSVAAIALIGIAITFYFLLQEIAYRRKKNKELARLTEYYSTAMNMIREGLITTDKNGDIFFMNAAAEKLTGWSSQEAISLPLEKVYNVMSEEHGKSFEPIASRILATGEAIRYENNTLLCAKNKKKLIISNSGSPLFDRNGNISGTIVVFNDITEKKKIESRLKRSLRLNKGMLNSLTSRIVVVDASGTIIKVNKSWNTFVRGNGGVILENFGIGANYFDIWKVECTTSEGTQEKAIEGIKRVLNGTLNDFYLEYPCYRPEGETWFCMMVTRFVSAESLVVIEHNDINQRKKTEERMMKAIERYDVLARATSDTIWDWDVVSNKMQYNTSISNTFGYQNTEIENVPEWWKENVHPDDLAIVWRSLLDVFENKLETIQLEYRFRCADGIYKDIYDRAFIMYDDQRAVRVIGAMQDVTYKKDEEKRITKAIMDAQEHERNHIGLELHDNVNQILAGTQLTLSMAKDKLIDRDKMLEFIDISKGYITNAIEELRKLSHELVPASFDDNTLKTDFENLLLDINLDNRFDIYFQFDDGINDAVKEDIQINLYRILQEQVKNIVACSGADKIEISLHLSGDLVKMRTFDNGNGFNVKDVRKGIGLRNMKKRVDSFSGKFILNSSPGNGCEIIIEIPTTG